MVALTELLLIILIIITFSLQPIDLRVYGDKDVSLEISFTFFSLQLTDLTKRTRKRKQKLTKRLKKIRFASIAARELIHYSKVTLFSQGPFISFFEESPEKIAVPAAALSLLTAYLRNNSAEYYEELSENNKLAILLTFHLHELFISLVKASYYLVKSKNKRGIRSVR